ncbi:hypothetical protein MLD38_007234 [Melastoma candidum]|uniref:Uncharacterized protein n=1 Tax=Melastoma candidum TaxID=119954 RepID=A0ACB9RTH1_9MYRT|nr:hypothetical protein MLD38_007234 [Melastoma candidum]
MEASREGLTLVGRKPLFGLPTSCPFCLPVFIYLKFSRTPFHFHINFSMPDFDQIPYVEVGAYVAYNNEKGGVIGSLRDSGVADLDSRVASIPEFVSMTAMVTTWLKDAVEYELWLGYDGALAYDIYYSDLPWPLGKLLCLKQIHALRFRFGITKDNTEQKEAEIFKRVQMAYEALSTRLGEDDYFFEDRPSSLDAAFLGHALFTLQALPESSVLRIKLLEHGNLVRYAEKHKATCLDAASSSHGEGFIPTPASSIPRQGTKPKRKQRRERTEEEKNFRKKTKYFLIAQVIAVLSFLTIMNRSDDGDVDFDEEDSDVVDYD